MLSIFLLAALIWWGGGFAGLDRRLRLSLLALIFLAVLAIQLTLPDGAPLRAATGGSAAPWLMLAGAVVLVMAYRHLLRRLRSRAQPDTAEETATKPRADKFSDSELDRYARHIVLRELGGPGQKKLRKARVLVIGAGGLGAPAPTTWWTTPPPNACARAATGSWPMMSLRRRASWGAAKTR